MRAESTAPQLVVLDLSASPRVDLQSAHALAGMADELGKRGIQVRAVDARSSVRDRLRRIGVDARLGGINQIDTVANVVAAFQSPEAGEPAPSTTRDKP